MRINGERHYICRSVRQKGEVLEVFATKSWDCRTALRFLEAAMKRYGAPELIGTDRLPSYCAAMNVIGVSEC